MLRTLSGKELMLDAEAAECSTLTFAHKHEDCTVDVEPDYPDEE